MTGSTSSGPRARVALVAICTGALVVSCASSNGKTADPTPVASSAPSTAAAAAVSTAASTRAAATTVVTSVGASGAPANTTAAVVLPTTVAFVPANGDSKRFDATLFATPAPVTNPWLPLTVGYQSVREGKVSKGSRRLPHRRVFTVTDVTKEVAGVRTVLVLDQDFDGGELAEQAIDYLALDGGGNVWYLGSYTESYEGGQFVNVNDAWLAGVDGGRAGILMLADPHPGLPSYEQATVPGEGTAKAEVTKQGQSVCVPFKCYEDVLVIKEGGSENTYFARGVGGIRLEPLSGNPQETEELINLTQLSEQGVAELSVEALRLDEHARTEADRVFGKSAVATRPR